MTITVQIDKQEKDPLLFPDTLLWTPPNSKVVLSRVKTEVVVLPYGDYRLKSWKTGCVVERKGSLDEVATNLCSAHDKARFWKAWNRFLDHSTHPILFLDWPISRCQLRHFKSSRETTETVMSKLWDLIYRSGFHERNGIVIWGGYNKTVQSRVAAGAELLRLILTLKEFNKKEKKNVKCGL